MIEDKICYCNDTEIDLFIDAKNYLIESIEPMITTYLCNIWDPLIEHILIKEINSLIKNDLKREFPDLPKELRPKYIYRIHDDEDEKNADVEICIQQFLNKEKGLLFLGNYMSSNDLEPSYDLYCTPYYDGLNDFLFYARYGHTPENFMTGSSDARSEYYLGVVSPLSVAYGMAVHDGYINT